MHNATLKQINATNVIYETIQKIQAILFWICLPYIYNWKDICMEYNLKLTTNLSIENYHWISFINASFLAKPFNQ